MEYNNYKVVPNTLNEFIDMFSVYSAQKNCIFYSNGNCTNNHCNGKACSLNHRNKRCEYWNRGLKVVRL